MQLGSALLKGELTVAVEGREDIHSLVQMFHSLGCSLCLYALH